VLWQYIRGRWLCHGSVWVELLSSLSYILGGDDSCSPSRRSLSAGLDDTFHQSLVEISFPNLFIHQVHFHGHRSNQTFQVVSGGALSVLRGRRATRRGLPVGNV